MAEFVKLKEAAPELGVKYYWLRQQALANKIPFFRTGGNKGTFMVNVEAVREALAKLAA